MKYPKIHTLWKRNPETHKIIEGAYSKEEFESITQWYISEKIDGTNIRIYYKYINHFNDDLGFVTFKGRTNKAEIPSHLLDYLKKTFTPEKMYKEFIEGKERDFFEIILYGEGYGPKIQTGHLYRNDVSFILFDAKVGNWWLESQDLTDIANRLNCDPLPYLYSDLTEHKFTKKECLHFIKEKLYKSTIPENYSFEGIVARSAPMMLFRDGTPIMFKLKVKDYE